MQILFLSGLFADLKDKLGLSLVEREGINLVLKVFLFGFINQSPDGQNRP